MAELIHSVTTRAPATLTIDYDQQTEQQKQQQQQHNRTRQPQHQNTNHNSAPHHPHTSSTLDYVAQLPIRRACRADEPLRLSRIERQQWDALGVVKGTLRVILPVVLHAHHTVAAR